MFNADKRRQFVQRPRIIVDDVEHEGRVLSWEEWAPHLAKLQPWMQNKVSDAEALDDLKAFLNDIFPTKPAVVERILKLEPAVFEEAMVYFFTCHRLLAEPKESEEKSSS